MRFSLILVVLGLLPLGVVAAGETPARNERPNILVLLADDLGYGELGSYGQTMVQTPHLDALAARGLRFTDFYAGSPVCSPSRAVLMTGIHAGRVSIRGNRGWFEEYNQWDRVALRPDEATLGEMLGGAGYQTAFIGKWHLGDADDLSTWATSRGFDYAVQEQWANDRPGSREFTYQMQYVDGDQAGAFYDQDAHDCLDKFRTDLAVTFLAERRDAERPLFLVMSYRSPHAHETYIRERERYADAGWPDLERTHAARITMLDEQVQRLLDTLERRGELENTLVLFTSDNGPHAEKGHDPAFFDSARGLRGHKRDLYEGGIRVPLIAVWPGRVAAGAVTEFPAAFHDVMPTLAEAAGIDAPAQTTGTSFLPTLLGVEQAEPDHLYWSIQNPGSPDGYRQAVRRGPWKAVRYADKGATELYDLRHDVNEETDLSSAHPEVLAEMNALIVGASEPSRHYPWAGRLAGDGAEPVGE